MANEKVSFKDLSWPLKVSVLISWGIGILYIFFFLVGFIIGLIVPI